MPKEPREPKKPLSEEERKKRQAEAKQKYRQKKPTSDEEKNNRAEAEKKRREEMAPELKQKRAEAEKKRREEMPPELKKERAEAEKRRREEMPPELKKERAEAEKKRREEMAPELRKKRAEAEKRRREMRTPRTRKKETDASGQRKEKSRATQKTERASNNPFLALMQKVWEAGPSTAEDARGFHVVDDDKKATHENNAMKSVELLHDVSGLGNADPPPIITDEQKLNIMARTDAFSSRVISICATCGFKDEVEDGTFVKESIANVAPYLTLDDFTSKVWNEHEQYRDVLHAYSYDGNLYHIDPDLVEDSEDGTSPLIPLCRNCAKCLLKKKIRPFPGYATGFDFGNIDKMIEKNRLTPLTDVETLMVSHVRHYGVVFQFHSESTSKGSPAHSTGHIISFPTNAACVSAKALPDINLDHVTVVIMGPATSLDDGVVRRFFQIRKDPVYEWLRFFKAVNFLYSDIEIDENKLTDELAGELTDQVCKSAGKTVPNNVAEMMHHRSTDNVAEKENRGMEQILVTQNVVPTSEADACKLLLESVLHLVETEQTPTSGSKKDDVDDDDKNDDKDADDVGDYAEGEEFENGLDESADQQQQQQREVEGAEDEVPGSGDNNPAGTSAQTTPPIVHPTTEGPVNDFTDFHRMMGAGYPTIFSVFNRNLTHKAMARAFEPKHIRQIVLNKYCRFGNARLGFFLFNRMQRLAVCAQTSAVLKGDAKLGDALLELMKPDMVEMLKRGIANPESQEAKNLEKRLAAIVCRSTCHVPFSPQERRAAYPKIKAIYDYMGPPSIFLTISPGDMDCASTIRLSTTSTVGGKNLTFELPAAVSDRMRIVAENPAWAAIMFNRIVEEVYAATLGVNLHKRSSARRTPVGKPTAAANDDDDMVPDDFGIFGRVRATKGVVEVQGRGSLHVHILIWSDPIPAALEEAISTCDKDDPAAKQFRDHVFRAIDSMVSTETQPYLTSGGESKLGICIREPTSLTPDLVADQSSGDEEVETSAGHHDNVAAAAAVMSSPAITISSSSGSDTPVKPVYSGGKKTLGPQPPKEQFMADGTFVTDFVIDACIQAAVRCSNTTCGARQARWISSLMFAADAHASLRMILPKKKTWASMLQAEVLLCPMHVNGNHWVLAAKVREEWFIYDSAPHISNGLPVVMLRKVLGNEAKIEIAYTPRQTQNDCALFAIRAAVNTLLALENRQLTWQQLANKVTRAWIRDNVEDDRDKSLTAGACDSLAKAMADLFNWDLGTTNYTLSYNNDDDEDDDNNNDSSVVVVSGVHPDVIVEANAIVEDSKSDPVAVQDALNFLHAIALSKATEESASSIAPPCQVCETDGVSNIVEVGGESSAIDEAKEKHTEETTTGTISEKTVILKKDTAVAAPRGRRSAPTRVKLSEGHMWDTRDQWYVDKLQQWQTGFRPAMILPVENLFVLTVMLALSIYVCRVVTSLQLHRHSATCWKKSGQNCRFGMPSEYCSETGFLFLEWEQQQQGDHTRKRICATPLSRDHGGPIFSKAAPLYDVHYKQTDQRPITLKTSRNKERNILNDRVVGYNNVLSAVLGCNIAVLLMECALSSRKMMQYLMTYLTKNACELTASLFVLAETLDVCNRFPSTAEDAGTQGREALLLLQRFSNRAMGKIEVSSQLAWSAVLGMPSHYTECNFIRLNVWNAMVFAMGFGTQGQEKGEGQEEKEEAETEEEKKEKEPVDDDERREAEGRAAAIDAATADYEEDALLMDAAVQEPRAAGRTLLDIGDGEKVAVGYAEHYAFRGPHLEFIHSHLAR